MRCIMVNGEKLKADAFCAYCRNRIGENYLREISTRLLYCDYNCYRVAEQISALAHGHRSRALAGWTFGS